WLQRLVDEHLHNFTRLGRDLAVHDVAGKAIDADEIAFFHGDAADGEGPFVVIDDERVATDDADLAHLPGDERRMRRSAAERGEDAVGRLHAAQVLWRGFAANE